MGNMGTGLGRFSLGHIRSLPVLDTTVLVKQTFAHQYSIRNIATRSPTHVYSIRSIAVRIIICKYSIKQNIPDFISKPGIEYTKCQNSM
jgi:hypothetical protein